MMKYPQVFLSFTVLLLSLLCSGFKVYGNDTSVPPSWLTQVENQIKAQEYYISPSDKGLQAPNRAHNFRTYFNKKATSIYARTGTKNDKLFSLRFGGLFRTSAKSTSTSSLQPAKKLSYQANKVTLEHHNNIDEWFINSQDGLEHGFTLNQQLAGSSELALIIQIDDATVSQHGDAIKLSLASGRVLDYKKLKVFDAQNKLLSSRMQKLSDHQLAIYFDDREAQYPLVVDPLITATDDAQLEENDAGSRFGYSVAMAGDVNGDGFADVIVGARDFDNGGTERGAAFVYHGSSSGINTTAVTSLYSDQDGSDFGFEVNSAGDVNGDGYVDVIVGAYNYDSTNTDDGAAFVYYGSGSGISASGFTHLQNGLANSEYGFSVSGVGDVNGDGYADVAVGAPDFESGQTNEGVMYVYHGSASGVNTSFDFKVEGGVSGMFFGRSVALAGDVNGDGYADVIAGSLNYSNGQSDEGGAFLYYGKSSGLTFPPDAILQSNQANAKWGWVVSGAGDVNGDGYSDVLVGAPFDGDGKAYVFHGSSSGVDTSYDRELTITNTGAKFGYDVGKAGDINGDGYGDIVVSANLYDGGETDEGGVFVYLGSSNGVAATHDYLLEKNLANDEFGVSVAGGGDINGDGYSDLIVGMPLFANPDNNEGGAFIYYGGVSGLNTAVQWQFESNQTDAQLGLRVAGAGDVNGDGFNDVLVSTPYYDNGQTDEGVVFVFHGSATGLSPSINTTLEINEIGAEFGYGLSGAGDVNGDGYGDVIVGARVFDGGVTDSGAAFVYLGSSTGIDTATTRQLTITQTDTSYGRAVSGAGDVNGDGYDDVIVGATRYDNGETNEGAVFVYHGSPQGINTSVAIVLESGQGYAQLGYSVSNAGDVNGDGYADIIAGANLYNESVTDEGGAFIYHGSSTGIQTPAARIVAVADEGSAYFGRIVADAGDVNGDGYDDVIIGAHAINDVNTDDGKAWVFHGSSSGIGAAANTELSESQAYGYFGITVAGAGDVNGDGYADVIVGAYKYNNPDTDEGTAYVYLGSSSGVQTSYANLLEIDQANARFGSEVDGVGDINGDGFADVVVAAYHYTNTESDEGAVFVYYGNSDGRLVKAQQLSSDNSIIPNALRADEHDSFKVSLIANSPRGRERAKLEIQTCPQLIAWGHADCIDTLSSTWTDLGADGSETLVETVTGLNADSLYRWRARVLYQPFTITEAGITPTLNPHFGPWFRLKGQANGVDVRTGSPNITAASYDFSTATLTVIGQLFTALAGDNNDVDISKITLTGENGDSYTLTGSDVEIDSATQFTIVLAGEDKLVVNGLFNNNGTSSEDSTVYNLAVVDDFIAAFTDGKTADNTTAVTVSNYTAPTISSANYNHDSKILSVGGANLVRKTGASNDVDVSKITITGLNGNTYTLTTDDVDITSDTAFDIVLNASDQTNVEALLDLHGTQASDTTVYNLAVAEDWMPAASTSAVISDPTTGITTVNVPVPTITSATYDYFTGQLVVTGSHFVAQNGSNNDIALSKLTITGAGNNSHVLTGTDVDIDSTTQFTITFTSTEKTIVDGLFNNNGTASDDNVTYNLAVIDDFNVLSTEGDSSDSASPITVSNYTNPSISSATYDASTGEVVVTGERFVNKDGANNDVDLSRFTFSGEFGETYALTTTTDVEISSSTSFSFTLTGADLNGVNSIINDNGTDSANGFVYWLIAGDNWMTASNSAQDTSDTTNNSITVSNVPTPSISSATYNASTGLLTVTGDYFYGSTGANNDVVVSKLTVEGEGGATYSLTTSDVDVTNINTFSVNLNATDKLAVNGLLNTNGSNADDNTSYNLAVADDFIVNRPSGDSSDLSGNAITVSGVIAPTISSVTYDGTSGVMQVTGGNFVGNLGANNDVNTNVLTIEGMDGQSYPLTNTLNIGQVEVTSDTQFSLTVIGAERASLNALLNKAGNTSDDNVAYNLIAADNWMLASAPSIDISDSTNSITVMNVPVPTISAVTYNASSGLLSVTGSEFITKFGLANDVDVSKFAIDGFVLTTTNVELTDNSSFAITLSEADQLHVNGLLNKDGTLSGSGSSYNLVAADNWLVNVADATDISLPSKGITVSGVVAPSITSMTYDAATGVVTVTGLNFVKKIGDANDVDLSQFTFTGENGQTYTLTTAIDVEITSKTKFSFTLTGADLLAVSSIFNDNGMDSSSGVVYNIAAADNWMTASDSTVDISDQTGNSVTVSNLPIPSIDSATYDATSGVLTVTGNHFYATTGADNDVVVSKLAVKGEGGATYTLTTSDVDATDINTFSVNLNAVDKLAVNGLLNTNGTAADDNTSYNLAVDDDFIVNRPSGDSSDLSGNAITVSGVTAPTISSVTYDGTSGVMQVTGADFVANLGANNDVNTNVLTINGMDGQSYPLTTGLVELISDTQYSLTVTGAERASLNALLNKAGTASDDNVAYNLSAADNWMLASAPSVDISDNTNSINVSNVPVPTISAVTYNASSGLLSVTGSEFITKFGLANDVDVSKFTIDGFVLTTTNVELIDHSSFTITLSEADQLHVNGLLNKDGTLSSSGSSYNFAAADNWLVNVADATDISLPSNVITVSGVVPPSITSITYDAATGMVTVTGVNFVKKLGDANDVDLSQFTFTGEDGQTYTLTTAIDVEITSKTKFSFTLTGADLLGVNGIFNDNGADSTNGVVYNLAAADNWMVASDENVDIADQTNNGVIVSNLPIPIIDGATYDATSGILTVTGDHFYATSGDDNDVVVSYLSITGQGGVSYTLTSADVDISSQQTFSVSLNTADKLIINGLLNSDGATADDNTAYTLAVADDFIVDRTAGDSSGLAAISVAGVMMPYITSASYDGTSGQLVVTGGGFVNAIGDDNDVDTRLLTISGKDGQSHTLTLTLNEGQIEVTSESRFSLAVNERSTVNAILHNAGTMSDDGEVYNLSAADNWMLASATSVDISDIANNAITVSNVPLPTVLSAQLDFSTGELTVSGSEFIAKLGADNDVDVSKLSIVGHGGESFALTSSDVDITNTASFKVILNQYDRESLEPIVNKNGTLAVDSTTYNLVANQGWLVAASSDNDINDLTGNGVTALNVPEPRVSLFVDSSSMDENEGSLVLTAQLSAAYSENVTIGLAYAGTATEDVDYTAVDDISINSGLREASITLYTIDDDFFDASSDETIVVSISAIAPSGVENGIQTKTLTIVDDETAPIVTLTADNTISEDGTTSTVTVSLDKPSFEDVTVSLGVTGVDVSDYNLVSNQLVIAAGQTSSSTVLSAQDDGLVEGNETLTVSIDEVFGGQAVESGVQSQAVMISDNDNAQVTLSADSVISEDGAASTVTASLDKPSFEDVTVTIGVTGVDPSDYSLVSNSIVIAAGQRSNTTILSAQDDGLVEGNETLTVSIDGVSGGQAVESGTQSQAVVINDNDNAQVTLAADSVISEDGATSTVTASLDKPSFEDVTVTLGVTGVDPSDYSLASNSIVIAAGQRSNTTILSAQDDGLVEGSETLTVSIDGVSGGQAVESGTQSQAVVISDNDNAQVTLSADSVISEDGAASTVTASLDKPSFEDVTVTLGVTGVDTSDYSLVSNSIVIAAGQRSSTTILSAQDDGLVEGSETLTVSIDGVFGGQAVESGVQSQAVVINDNDNAQVTLAADSVISEDGATSRVTVSLDKPSFEDVTITLGVTGVDPSDYSLVSNSIVIAAGQRSNTTILSAQDDGLVEGNETLIVSIDGVSGGQAVESGVQSQIVTITDNDSTQVTLTIDTNEIAESAGSATLTLSLSKVSFENVVVDLSYGGTATAGSDYQPPQTSVTIAKGELNQTLTLTAIQDDEIEPLETIITSITQVTGGSASESGDQRQTVNITDDDTAQVTLTADVTDIPESGGSATLTLTLSKATFEDVVVDLTYGGTATAGSDYQPPQTSVNIAKGELSETLTLAAIQDEEIEPIETIIAEIANVTGGSASESGDQRQSVNITDDDTAQVTLTTSVTDIAEDEGSATLTLTLSKATFEDVVVDLSYGGIATAGSDYQLPQNSVTIAKGELSQTLTLTAIQDDEIEPLETIITSITQVTGGSASESGDQRQTVNITDDDTAQVTLTADVTDIPESGGSATLTLTLSKATFEDVVVDLSYGGTATAGSDYQPPQTSVNIAKGELSQTITLTAIQDEEIEPLETIITSITQVTGGSASESGDQRQTVNITDDDTAQVTLTADVTDIPESGGSATLTLTLSKATFEDVVVDLSYGGTATAGSDYQPPQTSVNIAKGELSQTITLTAIQDEEIEPLETIIAEIANVTGGSASELGEQSQIVNITDDDTAQVTLTADVTDISEAAGSATLTLTLSKATFEDVVVDLSYGGTATSDSDYQSPQTSVTIAKGELSQTLILTAVQDEEIEPLETIIASITQVTGGSTSESGDQRQTVNITDDDFTQLTLTADQSTMSENGGNSILNLTLDKPTFEPVIVALNFSGDAVNDSDYSGAQTAVEIPVSEHNRTISLQAIQDEQVEADESINIEIVGVQGGKAQLGSISSQAIILTDDDQAFVTLTSDIKSFAENDGSSVLTVAIDKPSYETITVNLGYSGIAQQESDYSGAVNTIEIPKGEQQQIITLVAKQDEQIEPEENIEIEITEVSGGRASLASAQKQTLLLIDDDTAQVTLSASTNQVEESAGNVELKARLDKISFEDVAVKLSFSGSADDQDYTRAADVIVIPRGQLEGLTQLSIIDDEQIEANDSIVVDVDEVIGGSAFEVEQQQVIIDIQDDDFALVSLVASNDEQNEADGPWAFELQLNKLTFEDVNVVLSFAGSANSSDFSAPQGPFIITHGQTRELISVPIIDDGREEDDETVVVFIESVEGGLTIEDGEQQIQLTIVNDDDETPPKGYEFSITDAQIDMTNERNFSLSFEGAEIDAAYHYVIANGDNEIRANATVTDEQQRIAGIDVSSLTDGTLTVEFYLVDEAGNQGESLFAEVIKDATSPQATISVVSNDAASEPFNLLVEFSESVTGLSLEDFDVVNGRADNLQGVDNRYTLDVYGQQRDTVNLSLRANTVVDGFNNPNSEVTSSNWLYNPPRLNLVSKDPQTGADNGAMRLVLTLNFNRAVNVANPNGLISIFKQSGELIERVSAGSDMVSINDSEVKISFENLFERLEPYYVLVEAGIFVDRFGDSSAGFDSSSDWFFTIADLGPIVRVDNVVVAEDNTGQFAVLVNDSPNGSDINPATVEVTQAQHGQVSVSQTGVVTYIAVDENYHGEDKFTYTVSDFEGIPSRPADVLVTLTPVNDPPTAQADVGEVDEEGVVFIDVLDNDFDVDGDKENELNPYSIKIESGPNNGSATVVDGQIEYNPRDDFDSTDSFSYSVADYGGLRSEVVNVLVNVNGINDAPRLNGDAAVTDEDLAVEIDVLANDSDVDSEIDISSIVIIEQGVNGTAIPQSNGIVSYTPRLNFHGIDSFTYVVADEQGSTSKPALVSVTVHSVYDSPVANDDVVLAVEDTPIQFQVVGNDNGIDGVINGLEIVSEPNDGTVTQLTGSLLLNYSPGPDFNGLDSFSYQVMDDSGARSNVATVTLTIIAVNDAPVANDDEQQLAEDSSIEVDVLANDTDVENNIDVSRLKILSDPSHGIAVITDSGTVLYTPNEHYFGDDSFDYQIADTIGETAMASVSIRVNSVNDVPIAQPVSVETSEDVPVVILPQGEDVDGDSLTYLIDVSPQKGELDQQDNGWLYTPNAQVNGRDEFYYRAYDGIEYSQLAKVAINIGSVNQAPIVANQQLSLISGQTLAINLTGEDEDGDDLSYRVIRAPIEGLLDGSGDSYVYTANAGFSGVDYFDYVANDGFIDSAIARVQIEVKAENTPPDAYENSVSTREDIAVNIILEALDIDGDVLNYAIAEYPSHGRLNVNFDRVEYIPDENYEGRDSFSFTAADHSDVSLPATVEIDVIAVNDAPVAKAQRVQTNEDQSVAIQLQATDVELDQLTYFYQSPQNGQLSGAAPNLFYTPNDDFHGTDVFSYTVNDGELESNSAIITVTVSAVNDAPVAVNDVLDGIDSWQSLSLNVLHNDKDADDDTLTIIGAVSDAGLVDNLGSQLLFTPNDGLSSAVIYYVISDGNGATATASVNLIFNGIEDARPIIVVPSAIEVDAKGLLTKVELNAPQAFDANGHSIVTTLLAESSHFAPGNNTILWQATDNQDRTSTASQAIIVYPKIAITPQQQALEGFGVTIEVTLNGQSPVYPVHIPYRVSGSSEVGIDHNLQDGVITIESGTSGLIHFSVAKDNVFDAGEDIIVTLYSTDNAERPLNLSAQQSQTIIIAEQNIRPKVRLKAYQMNQPRTRINQLDGIVEVRTQIEHPDPNNEYLFAWHNHQGELIDLDDNEHTFSFDPADLTQGIYHLKVEVIDSDEQQYRTEYQVALNVQSQSQVLSENDSDGDGISDEQEGVSDSDGDGIVDYLDASDLCHVLPQEGGANDNYLIEGDIDGCMRLGDWAFIDQSQGSMVTQPVVDNMATNVGGLFDFVVSNLPLEQEQLSYRVGIAQRTPIPAGAIYRKMDAQGRWQNFVEDAHNRLYSAKGEQGICPALDSSEWRLGLNAGDWCVMLHLTDGGPNDADGIRNGTLVDPGGVAVLTDDNHFPVLIDDQLDTRQSVAATFDLLANDSDKDGDELTIISVLAKFGATAIVDNQLHYTPMINFYGQDQLSYAVSDGQGGTVTANAVINVVKNQWPKAFEDLVSTTKGETIAFDVLGNDVDPENDELSIVAVEAAIGAVSITSDNRLKYVAGDDFVGVDIIYYQIADKFGGIATGVVKMSVNELPPIPAEAPQQQKQPETKSGSSMRYCLLLLMFIVGFRRSKAQAKQVTFM